MNAAHWRAELSLEFSARGAATILSDCRHHGPLRVQKALYPEGEAVCQAIVLHPPSGVAGGDQLRISATVGAAANAQLTTPGAGKWYRSAGAEASQTLDFSVAENATLEWLPQETIVFDGARSHMDTHIALADSSRYLGWEILCLGRRAAGERFAHGHLNLHTRIERQGNVVWLERGHMNGNDPLLDSIAAWAGASVCATLQATVPAGFEVAPLLEACRSLEPADQALHGITALRGLLVARYLGHSSEAARLWFISLWQVLRPALLGRAAVPARIWNT
jgi:urease accessory protein